MDMMHVTVSTVSDNRSFDLDLPPDTTPKAIIQELIGQGMVPPPAPGHAYHLGVKGGVELNEPDRGLAASGVEDNATLRLYSTVPGASAGSPAIRVRRVAAVAPEPALPPQPTVLIHAKDHDVRIYATVEAMDQIWSQVGSCCVACGHPLSGTELERGGGLAGTYAVDPGGREFIVITDALAAPRAVSSRMHIEIRPEDWAEIHARLEEMPGKRLLGWYHSHPGLSVQMSGTDHDTQRRFFSEPWQVGLVVDPMSRAFLFHVGERGAPAGWLAFIKAPAPSPAPASALLPAPRALVALPDAPGSMARAPEHRAEGRLRRALRRLRRRPTEAARPEPADGGRE